MAFEEERGTSLSKLDVASPPYLLTAPCRSTSGGERGTSFEFATDSRHQVHSASGQHAKGQLRVNFTHRGPWPPTDDLPPIATVLANLRLRTKRAQAVL